jgi:uncharacterized protein (DUF433 family)
VFFLLIPVLVIIILHTFKTAAPAMNRLFTAVTVHPEIQDGAPVFSGTRIRIETFFDFMRIGISTNEFLNEFPSITPDQVMEVQGLANQQYTLDQISALASGNGPSFEPNSSRYFHA